MSSSQSFTIDVRALSEGVSRIQLHVDDAYFQSLDEDEIKRGAVDVTLTATKTSTACNIVIDVKGEVTVPCDLCLDDMSQPIEASSSLLVKIGSEYSDDGDVITLDDSALLDTKWLIYEVIALAIPARHVHAPGKCNTAMTKLLREHSAARSDGEEKAMSDSRWSALESVNVDN